MSQIPKTVCPFCAKSFELKVAEDEWLDTHHLCPCGCGAMVCLCLQDDTVDTIAELEGHVEEIRTIEKFDGLSDSEVDQVDTWITAIFWRT